MSQPGGVRRRNVGYGFLMMLMNFMRAGGASGIPIATLSFAAVNTLCYYINVFGVLREFVPSSLFQAMGRFGALWQQGWLSELDAVSIIPANVWWGGEWWRVVLSSFYHVHEMHLAFNVVSLLWKGRFLEPRMGSRRFAWLCVVLALMANCIYVGLGVALDGKVGNLLQQGAVGFSNVLFGLKVVRYFVSGSWGAGGYLARFGLPPMGGQLGWLVELGLELLVAQMLGRRVSFWGHLAGIVAGIALCRTSLGQIVWNDWSILRDSAPTQQQHEAHGRRNPGFVRGVHGGGGRRQQWFRGGGYAR